MTAIQRHIHFLLPVNQLRRPALRYYGGKWLLARWIVRQFPAHRVYVEPFGGAASVLLRKQRSRHEVYNDLNLDLVNFFRVVRNPVTARKLIAALKTTPYSRHEFNQAYAPAELPVERARQLVIRSLMGFGGHGASRVSRTGFRWQVSKKAHPYALDWLNYPQSLKMVVERLRGIVIEHKPAAQIIQAYDAADTLFYVDPPYLWETRSKNAKYAGYSHEMTNEDHENLLNQLRKTKGKVVLSGYDSPLYNDMLSDWQKVSKHTYTIGGRKRTEMLWIKPDASNETGSK